MAAFSHPHADRHYGVRVYRMAHGADQIQVVQVDKAVGASGKYTGSKIPPGHPQNRYDNHPSKHGQNYPVDAILSEDEPEKIQQAVMAALRGELLKFRIDEGMDKPVQDEDPSGLPRYGTVKCSIDASHLADLKAEYQGDFTTGYLCEPRFLCVEHAGIILAQEPAAIVTTLLPSAPRSVPKLWLDAQGDRSRQ